MNICEPQQTNYEAGPNTFHIEAYDHDNKLQNYKDVQVNIKRMCRRKGLNVSYTIKKKKYTILPTFYLT